MIPPAIFYSARPPHNLALAPTLPFFPPQAPSLTNPALRPPPPLPIIHPNANMPRHGYGGFEPVSPGYVPPQLPMFPPPPPFPFAPPFPFPHPFPGHPFPLQPPPPPQQHQQLHSPSPHNLPSQDGIHSNKDSVVQSGGGTPRETPTAPQPAQPQTIVSQPSPPPLKNINPPPTRGKLMNPSDIR